MFSACSVGNGCMALCAVNRHYYKQQQVAPWMENTPAQHKPPLTAQTTTAKMVHLSSKMISTSQNIPNNVSSKGIMFMLFLVSLQKCCIGMWDKPVNISELKTNRLQFNSLAPGRFQFNFRKVIFKQILVNGGWRILQNCLEINATRTYWWQVNIGSGNGLVPLGNKPSPEPMLTQIYIANWHH